MCWLPHTSLSGSREILVELSYRCQGLPSSDLLPQVRLSYNNCNLPQQSDKPDSWVQTLKPMGDISHPDPNASP